MKDKIYVKGENYFFGFSKEDKTISIEKSAFTKLFYLFKLCGYQDFVASLKKTNCRGFL